MKIFSKIPGPKDWTFDDDAGDRFKLHDFLLHDPRWIFTDNFKDAELIPLLPPTDVGNLRKTQIRLRREQVGLIMHQYAIDDHMDEFYLNNLLVDFSKVTKDRFIIVHKNKTLANIDNLNLVYHDSMFDAVKMYFIDYENKSLQDKIWARNSCKDFFNIPEIAVRPMKKFIYAAYVYAPYTHPRMKYRKMLLDVLKDYEDDGYIGSQTNRLLPNKPHQYHTELLKKGPPPWYPIADFYYQDTYLSIVVETLTGSAHGQSRLFDTKCVTEKTLEPLMKGNFVIPFGYSGLIKDILDYGFKLPDWIDYNYDKIKDPDLRFQDFVKSVKNVLSMPIDEMMNVYYYKDRIEILEHNRQVFFDRPYDDLYSKVKDRLVNLPR